MDLKVACMEARGFGPKRDTVAVLSVQLRVCYGARDNSVGMSNIFRLHRVGFSEANKTGGNCKIGGVGWRMIFAEECGSTTFIFHCADGASGPKQIGQLLLLEARAHAQGGISKHVVTRLRTFTQPSDQIRLIIAYAKGPSGHCIRPAMCFGIHESLHAGGFPIPKRKTSNIYHMNHSPRSTT